MGSDGVSGQQMPHGRLEVGMVKSEPRFEGFGRRDPVGSKQGICSFAVHEADGESRHGRKDMGSAEDAGEGAAEFPLRHVMGRDCIHTALPDIAG